MMKKLLLIIVLFFSQSALSDHLSKKTLEDTLENAETFSTCATYNNVMSILIDKGVVVGSPADKNLFFKKFQTLNDEKSNLLFEAHIEFWSEEWMDLADTPMKKVMDYFSKYGVEKMQSKYQPLCKRIWEYFED